MVGENTNDPKCKIICVPYQNLTLLKAIAKRNRITITIVGRAITLERAIKIRSNSNIEKKISNTIII